MRVSSSSFIIFDSTIICVWSINIAAWLATEFKTFISFLLKRCGFEVYRFITPIALPLTSSGTHNRDFSPSFCAIFLYLYSFSFVTSYILIGLFSLATLPATPSPTLSGGFSLYSSLIDWVALILSSLVFSSKSIKEHIFEPITSAVTVTISLSTSSRYKSEVIALLIFDSASICSDIETLLFGVELFILILVLDIG